MDTWAAVRSLAGLAGPRQQGWFVFCPANFPAMNALIALLGENCCIGRDPLPAGSLPRRKRPS